MKNLLEVVNENEPKKVNIIGLSKTATLDYKEFNRGTEMIKMFSPSEKLFVIIVAKNKVPFVINNCRLKDLDKIKNTIKFMEGLKNEN